MRKRILFISGCVFGVLAGLLAFWGNPGNMGFCMSCFLRDIAGAMKLHTNLGTSYMRPEILGLVIGAFCLSLIRREFRPTSGSAPMLRFLLGFAMMVGSLMFLGCPVRAVLRLAAGDLNAIFGILGLVAGIFTGSRFLDKGFSLGRTKTEEQLSAMVFPAISIVLLLLLLFSSSLFAEGAAHAPLLLSLSAGLIVGTLAQYTRFCSIGAFRDIILIRDFSLFTGIAGLFAGSLVTNLITGNFNPGFSSQPVAHTSQLWNFLGLYLVGLAATMAGGCPLRQLILASSGNSDSAVTVLGLVIGAAFVHNFGLASSASGPTVPGRIATIVFILICLMIAFTVTIRNNRNN